MGASWVPPIACWTVILSIYFGFLFNNLVPQLQHLSAHSSANSVFVHPDPHVHTSTMGEVVFVTIAFHFLFVLLIISFARAMLTSPGSIPLTSKWTQPFPISAKDEKRVRKVITDPSLTKHFLLTENDIQFIRHMPVVERKQKNGKYRKCVTCGVFKPDRCHHCRVCETCVLRMDHHCPWIANCVGFHNYKFFLLLLFYAICCTGFVIATMLPRFIMSFEPVLDWNYFVTMDLPVCVVYFMCVFLFAGLVAFFSFHMYLTLNAMTTIELKEKKNHEDEYVQHRFLIANTKWNVSRYENFVHVFGPPWMWLLPIKPHSISVAGTMEEDGTYACTSYSPNGFSNE